LATVSSSSDVRAGESRNGHGAAVADLSFSSSPTWAHIGLRSVLRQTAAASATISRNRHLPSTRSPQKRTSLLRNGAVAGNRSSLVRRGGSVSFACAGAPWAVEETTQQLRPRRKSWARVTGRATLPAPRHARTQKPADPGRCAILGTNKEASGLAENQGGAVFLTVSQPRGAVIERLATMHEPDGQGRGGYLHRPMTERVTGRTGTSYVASCDLLVTQFSRFVT
jgi:hypothetical protein